MRKIVLRFWNGNDQPTISKSFEGRWIIGDAQSGERADDDSRNWDAGAGWSVALTAKGNLVVYIQHCNDGWAPEMGTYSTPAELLGDSEIPENVRSMAAGELGQDFEVQLDV